MQTMISPSTSNAVVGVVDWQGGDGTFFAAGVFSGGTATLEASIDGGMTWITCRDSAGAALSIVVDGAISFSIGACKLRVSMSGATVEFGMNQTYRRYFTSTGDPLAAAGMVTLTIKSVKFASPVAIRVFFPKGSTQAECMDLMYNALEKHSAYSANFYTVKGPDYIQMSELKAVSNDTTMNLEFNPNGLTGFGASFGSINNAGVAATPRVLVSLQNR